MFSINRVGLTSILAVAGALIIYGGLTAKVVTNRNNIERSEDREITIQKDVGKIKEAQATLVENARQGEIQRNRIEKKLDNIRVLLSGLNR